MFRDVTPETTAIGEASVHYLRSSHAIHQIVKSCPDAKFVVMLRDPLEFLPSYHTQMVFSLTENLTDFADAWQTSLRTLERDGIEAFTCEPELLNYSAAAMFGQQIQRLLQVVDRDKVLFLEFETLKRQPRLLYQQVVAHIGAVDDGRSDFPVHNAAHASRSNWLAGTLRKVQRASRGWAHQTWMRPVRNLGSSLWQWNQTGRARNPMTNDLRAELAEHFAADRELVGKLTGLDVTHWLKTTSLAH